MLFVLPVTRIHRRWEEMWKVNISYVSKLVGNVPEENTEKEEDRIQYKLFVAMVI
jgi:hypothetical protein